MMDYTYIDCHNGNDATAEPFNHEKPYNSLAGIASSVSYVNEHWNVPENMANVT